MFPPNRSNDNNPDNNTEDLFLSNLTGTVRSFQQFVQSNNDIRPNNETKSKKQKVSIYDFDIDNYDDDDNNNNASKRFRRLKPPIRFVSSLIKKSMEKVEESEEIIYLFKILKNGNYSYLENEEQTNVLKFIYNKTEKDLEKTRVSMIIKTELQMHTYHLRDFINFFSTIKNNLNLYNGLAELIDIDKYSSIEDYNINIYINFKFDTKEKSFYDTDDEPLPNLDIFRRNSNNRQVVYLSIDYMYKLNERYIPILQVMINDYLFLQYHSSRYFMYTSNLFTYHMLVDYMEVIVNSYGEQEVSLHEVSEDIGLISQNYLLYKQETINNLKNSIK